MRSMIDFTAPLAGLDTADATVNVIASKIAKGNDPEDRVDLSEAMVYLSPAKSDFDASARMIQTENQMSQKLLDIMA